MSKLHTFTEGILPKDAKDIFSKDLYELQQNVGGKIGVLSDGRHELKNVLQVSEGLYVTTERVPRAIKTTIAMDNDDLHEVKNRADVFHFIHRVRANG